MTIVLFKGGFPKSGINPTAGVHNRGYPWPKTISARAIPATYNMLNSINPRYKQEEKEILSGKTGKQTLGIHILPPLSVLTYGVIIIDPNLTDGRSANVGRPRGAGDDAALAGLSLKVSLQLFKYEDKDLSNPIGDTVYLTDSLPLDSKDSKTNALIRTENPIVISTPIYVPSDEIAVVGIEMPKGPTSKGKEDYSNLTTSISINLLAAQLLNNSWD